MRIIRRLLTTESRPRPFRRVMLFSSMVLVTAAWGWLAYPKQISEPIVQKQPKKLLPLLSTPLITHQELNELLTKKQLTIGDANVRVHTNQVPANTPIEDFQSHMRVLDENGELCGLLLGVYDGHGGTECASLLKRHLSSYVASHILKIPKLPASEANDKPDLQRHIQVQSAMINAFMELDADILSGAIAEPQTWTRFALGMFIRESNKADIVANLKGAFAGSCAIVAFVSGKDIYVASTGDCRAVIGRDTGYKGVMEAIELSVDQTPRNPSEYARLMEEHPGEESTVVSRGRVLGGLMPSRAFGDARYKYSLPTLLKLQKDAFPDRRIPRNYKSPPYVTAKPEVTHIEVGERDLFMVIATDGLWDELSSQNVVDVAASNIKSGENVATKLIEAAFTDSAENHPNPDYMRHMMSIPKETSRRYRDDVTVNVVIFSSGDSGDSSSTPHFETVGAKVNGKSRLDAWMKALN